MDTFYNENAIKLITEIIKEVIRNNNFSEAFKLMNKHFTPISNNLCNIILSIEADFNDLKTKINEKKGNFRNGF